VALLAYQLPPLGNEVGEVTDRTAKKCLDIMRISYRVKDGGGQVHAEGSISVTRVDLRLERRKGEEITNSH
jgi:hypothetical protein